MYQLSPDLDIVATAKTGPRNDSKDCSFSECTQNLTRKLTDNINKVLLIDYSTSRLITCGSLFQGICSVRSLQNISSPEQDVVEAIVANSESKCYCEKREECCAETVLKRSFLLINPHCRCIDGGIYCARTTGTARYKCDVCRRDIRWKFTLSERNSSRCVTELGKGTHVPIGIFGCDHRNANVHQSKFS